MRIFEPPDTYTSGDEEPPSPTPAVAVTKRPKMSVPSGNFNSGDLQWGGPLEPSTSAATSDSSSHFRPMEMIATPEAEEPLNIGGSSNSSSLVEAPSMAMIVPTRSTRDSSGKFLMIHRVHFPDSVS